MFNSYISVNKADKEQTQEHSDVEGVDDSGEESQDADDEGTSGMV
jgi:hypothetical protein